MSSTMTRLKLKRLKKGIEYTDPSKVYPCELGPLYFQWLGNKLTIHGPEWDERTIYTERFDHSIEGVLLIDRGKLLVIRNNEPDEGMIFTMVVVNGVNMVKPIRFPDFISPRDEMPVKVILDMFNENCFVTYGGALHHWRFRNETWTLENVNSDIE